MVQELGRNDPCWCRSGKKYKKCHLNRESEQPLPLEARLKAAQAAWDHKECLHPQAAPGACDRIVSAHTIQRSGVLERIIDSTNHVRTFYRSEPDSTGRLKLRRVGWREASTFTGFCARHDGLTFGPLETAAFAGTAEQCFLAGYRALCHEIYQKSGSLKASPVLRRLADRGLPVELQRDVQHTHAIIDAGTRKGLAAFRRLKTLMDKQLVEGEFSGWSRAVISFRGDLCVASTGAVSPNRDLKGQQLQVLHDPHVDQESLFYSVVAALDGGAVVLTWLSREIAPRAFVESLLKQGNQRLPSLLVQFMFAYVENTYFSGRWWESLSGADRRHVESLAGTIAYWADPRCSLSQFVPWEITKVIVEGAA